MKKLILTTLLATTALIVEAKAESKTSLPTPVIGIVDAQAVLDGSSAAAGVKKEIESKRNQIQKDIAKQEQTLRAEDKKLGEEQKKLPEKEYVEKRQEFEKKVVEAQNKIEISRVQLELAFEEARAKVLQAFLKAAENVRQKVGATMLIYKDHIVVADKSLDVSSQVLEAVNKELPSVKVTYKSDSEIKNLIQSQKKK